MPASRRVNVRRTRSKGGPRQWAFPFRETVYRFAWQHSSVGVVSACASIALEVHGLTKRKAAIEVVTAARSAKLFAHMNSIQIRSESSFLFTSDSGAGRREELRTERVILVVGYGVQEAGGAANRLEQIALHR